MSWAKLDDTCREHPKLLSVSDKAFRLWASALTYCAQHLTDGFVPLVVLSSLGVKGNVKRAADQLCKPWANGAKPLWEKVADGYQIHDYLKKDDTDKNGWNDPKVKVLSRRDTDATRQRQWREGKRNGHAVTPPVTHAVSPTGVFASIPSHPIESPSETLYDGATNDDDAKTDDGFEAFWSLYPRRVGRGAAEKAWAKLKPSPSQRLTIAASVVAQRASEQWTKEGGRFIPHPSTWLNEKRWQDEVFAAKPANGRTGVHQNWDDTE